MGVCEVVGGVYGGEGGGGEGGVEGGARGEVGGSVMDRYGKNGGNFPGGWVGWIRVYMSYAGKEGMKGTILTL